MAEQNLTPLQVLTKKLNDNDDRIKKLDGWIEGIQMKEGKSPTEAENLEEWENEKNGLLAHNEKLTTSIAAQGQDQGQGQGFERLMAALQELAAGQTKINELLVALTTS